jgi:hypothetical protein
VLEEENLDGVEADFLLGLFHGLEPKTGELLKELEELLLSKRAYELAVDILTGNIDVIPGWLARGPVLALELRYKSAKETLRSRTLNAISALDLELKLKQMKNKITHPSQLAKYRLLAGGPKAFLYDALAKMIMRNPKEWHLPEEIGKRLNELMDNRTEHSLSEEQREQREDSTSAGDFDAQAQGRPSSFSAQSKEKAVLTERKKEENPPALPDGSTSFLRKDSSEANTADISASGSNLRTEDAALGAPRDFEEKGPEGGPPINLESLLGDVFRFEMGFS